MCGIAGFFSSQIEFKAGDKYRNILYEMKKSLFHRGPDDSGIYLGRHCGFAHTRLAIRDVNNGRQPMIRTINNNDYVIVYNGEIYKVRAGILKLSPIQRSCCFYFCNTDLSL